MHISVMFSLMPRPLRVDGTMDEHENMIVVVLYRMKRTGLI